MTFNEVNNSGARLMKDAKTVEPINPAYVVVHHEPGYDPDGKIHEGSRMQATAFATKEKAEERANDLAKKSLGGTLRVYKLESVYRAELPVKVSKS